jgi:hypothetical protein
MGSRLCGAALHAAPRPGRGGLPRRQLSSCECGKPTSDNSRLLERIGRHAIDGSGRRVSAEKSKGIAVMKIVVASLVIAVLAFATGAAEAKGCLKGAAVGGVAGHYAGHHGMLGAAAGCLYGHHRAKKQEEQQQQPQG